MLFSSPVNEKMNLISIVKFVLVPSLVGDKLSKGLLNYDDIIAELRRTLDLLGLWLWD